MVEGAVTALAPEAAACGVRLAIELLHPGFAADRSVITAAGYAGPIEVEIFNRAIHAMAADDVLALVRAAVRGASRLSDLTSSGG